MPLPQLNPGSPEFPEVESAAKDPNGLLAMGGDLSPALLIEAYSKGIFPWYDQYSPIMWWSPDPREVVLPNQQHWSKSMCKMRKETDLKLTTDNAFQEVIEACARQEDQHRWVTEEMIDAYIELHRLGKAHSVEVWQEDQLVGGLYGVAIGATFCGESMFHSASNASKFAFLSLADTLFDRGFQIIDCQFETDHLRSLGSSAIPRSQYIEQLTLAQLVKIEWPDTFAPVLS